MRSEEGPAGVSRAANRCARQGLSHELADPHSECPGAFAGGEESPRVPHSIRRFNPRQAAATSAATNAGTAVIRGHASKAMSMRGR